ncbi:MAG: TonB-dependent receptor, partial [Cyclobacteriaceae bacterium]
LNINSNTLLYGSFSTGFNAPSLYQLYDPTIGGTFITRGNRDLEPEESRSIELGVKRGLARTGYVTLSLFSTQTNNAIEYVYLWNKNTQIANLSFLDYEGDTYINLSQQTINGIEVAGYYEFGKFGLTGNLTWLNGTITSNPNDLPSDQIDGNHVQLFSNGAFINSENAQEHFARRPQLTAFSKLQFNFNENVSFNLNYRLAGSRFDSFYDPTLGPFGAQGSLEIDSYHLFDLGARVRISKILSATVSVENVFNTNYQEINGFLTRGRSAYLKLIAKW